MIRIVTTSNINSKGKLRVVSTTEMEGEHNNLAFELTAVLIDIEDMYPGIIGEALQHMIERARSDT